MARRVIGTAILEVKADLQNFNKALGGVGSGLRSTFSRVSGAIAGLGFGNLAKQAIEFGGTYRIQLDNARAAILGLTDSQQEADTLMKAMTTEAINTPFTLPGVTDMTTRLLALGQGFGVTSTNVVDWVHDLGNAAAATGKTTDNMNSVINIMGRISGQGRIMGRDMTQLNQNLPSLHPWEILAQVTGRSEESLRKLSLKPGGLTGIVDTTEFIDALRTGMQQLPGAAVDATTGLDAMGRKMATIGGTVEFFKDNIGVALADGLVPFFAAIQNGMKDQDIAASLNELIAAFSKLATEIVTAVMPILPTLIDSFTGIIEALMPMAPFVANMGLIFANLLVFLAPVIAAIGEFLTWITSLMLQLDPMLLAEITAALLALFFAPTIPIGLLIGAVVALAIVIANNWDAIVAATQNMVDAVVGWWNWLFENVIGPVRDFIMAIVNFFIDLYDTLVGNSIIPDLVNAIVGWFKKLWNWIVSIFTGIWNFFVSIWHSIYNTFVSIVTSIANWLSNAWNNIKTTASNIWNGVKQKITDIVNGIKDKLSDIWNSIKEKARNAWDNIKDTVADKVQWLKDKISGVIDGIVGFFRDLPGRILSAVGDIGGQLLDKITGPLGSIGGSIGNAIGGLFGHADGGVFNRPHIGLVAEAGPEAIIPMRNPMRAMQVMHQAGLDRMVASMQGQQRFSGPLVSMPNAIIQDATDADLVAQRTLVAMQAAMVA